MDSCCPYLGRMGSGRHLRPLTHGSTNVRPRFIKTDAHETSTISSWKKNKTPRPTLSYGLGTGADLPTVRCMAGSPGYVRIQYLHSRLIHWRATLDLMLVRASHHGQVCVMGHPADVVLWVARRQPCELEIPAFAPSRAPAVLDDPVCNGRMWSDGGSQRSSKVS